jgi:hypothetical protein
MLHDVVFTSMSQPLVLVRRVVITDVSTVNGSHRSRAAPSIFVFVTSLARIGPTRGRTPHRQRRATYRITTICGIILSLARQENSGKYEPTSQQYCSTNIAWNYILRTTSVKKQKFLFA